jgi:hypothetical protein
VDSWTLELESAIPDYTCQVSSVLVLATISTTSCTGVCRVIQCVSGPSSDASRVACSVLRHTLGRGVLYHCTAATDASGIPKRLFGTHEAGPAHVKSVARRGRDAAARVRLLGVVSLVPRRVAGGRLRTSTRPTFDRRTYARPYEH